MLCTVPAVRALKTAIPSSEITLLGLPWAATFVKRFNKYFDRFIHFPGYPGLPEQAYSPEAWGQFVKTIEKEEFDLVIQMQGNGTIVNPMLAKLNFKQIAGFRCQQSYVDSPAFIDYPEGVHEIDRHLLLMNHLGIPSAGRYLAFPLTRKDEEDFDKLFLPVLPKRYVCVHPGSRGISRQWPPSYFAALADHCIEQGYTVVLTGTSDEIDITREVKKCMKHPVIDLTGQTSIGAVAILIKNASFLISNCTGVSHIASALETPSIVISMDGEPNRWAPLNRQLHYVIDWSKTPHFEEAFEQTIKLIQKLQQPVLADYTTA